MVASDWRIERRGWARATPDEETLAATIARMEARFAARETARVLVGGYTQVSVRFAADLDDPRDVLLSRAAALILIREPLDCGAVG